MTELYACGRCNAVYWHPNGQNECYACGYTEFHNVTENALKMTNELPTTCKCGTRLKTRDDAIIHMIKHIGEQE